MSDRCADYDYEVPDASVAQEPPARREDARLLHVRRANGTLADRGIADLPELLRRGDLLVLNDTRVQPARLVGRRSSTGGRVTLLVLSARGRMATVLLGTRGTPLPGESIEVDGDRWRITAAHGEGRFDVVVETGRDVQGLMADRGRMPLPPYIHRDPVADPRDALDRERYQTTFARTGSAVAAPTAGLHLTPALLDAVAARGVEAARLRLDVGEGSFRPLRGEALEEHLMHTERYAVGAKLAERYAATRAAGGRVVAVGTTVVRALESAVADDGASLTTGEAQTDLFIRPGHAFRAVDALLTNFHQPRSTLLVLVAAFAELDMIRRAYAHAIGSGYRLFSYGDAMLLD